MGYIGRDNRVSTFTKQSITADGGTSFTLNQGVGDSSSVMVSIGGVVQQPDVAYTAAGTSLTFTSAPTNAYPIWVIYLGKELTVASETNFDNVASQTGVGDGTTTPVTLSNSVSSVQSIIVTLNGISQVPTTDFTVSGTTLTFTTAPSSAMAILIYYIDLAVAENIVSDETVMVSSLASTGTWPAWNGSALTGVVGASDITKLHDDIALLHFLRSIDSSSKIANMIEGWSDTFPDTNSIVGGGSLHRKNACTAMTSSSGPSGTSSASDNHSPASFSPNFQAFDGNKSTSNRGWATNTAGTHHIQYSFNNGLSAQVITSYQITSVTGEETRAPKNWTLQASNTGSFGGEEVTLDTQTDITWTSNQETKKWNFTNDTAYVHYRIALTANNGGSYYQLAEVEFHKKVDSKALFNVPLTLFDGANDRVTRGADLTGNADGKTGTFSGWLDINNVSKDGVWMNIMANTGNRFKVSREANNKIYVEGQTSSNTVVLQLITTNLYNSTTNPGLIHVLASWDIANAKGFLYINDAADLAASPTLVNTNIDYISGTANFGFGDRPDATQAKYAGSMGQMYFSKDYVDISVTANRRKFINADLTPVDFGANGSTPTGSQPIVYLNNSFDTFQTNLGTGGGFTESGQLVDGGYLDTPLTDALYSSESFSNPYELILSHGKDNAPASIVNDQQSSYSATNAHANIITLPDCIIRRYGVLAKKNSGSTGNVTAFISNVASGTISAATAVPSDVKLGTATLDISTVGTSFGIHYFDFSEPIEITAGEYVVGTEYNGISPHAFQRATVGGALGGTSDPNGMHARRLNGTGWVGVGEADHDNYDTFNHIFYIYGQKNLDLITKGSDDIGNSPTAAPEKGHMEVLLTESYTKIQTQVAQSYGTAFGNMLFQAPANGPEKAFDGVQIAINGDANGLANGNYPDVTPNGHYFVGKDWGTGVTKTISGVKVWGSNNEGYTGGTGKVSTALLMGSDAIPSQASSGTILGSIFNKLADVNNANAKEKLSGMDTTTAYRYHWIWLTNNTTSGAGFFAEVEFYEETDGNPRATINTEIVGQISRDGGTAWTDIPLTRIKTQVGGTNNNLLAGNADLTSTSGTNLKGRIKTVNKDKITVQGISVNWS